MAAPAQKTASQTAAVNVDELESLFAVLESSALRRLTAARATEICLIEHRRAHNISIELSGIRKPFPAIKVCRHNPPPPPPLPTLAPPPPPSHHPIRSPSPPSRSATGHPATPSFCSPSRHHHHRTSQSEPACLQLSGPVCTPPLHFTASWAQLPHAYTCCSVLQSIRTFQMEILQCSTSHSIGCEQVRLNAAS